MAKYLGKHLIIEISGATNLNSAKMMDKVLRSAVKACGATLLDVRVRKFVPQGISGFAMISESHISIHTWPEHKYAAADVFTCGSRVDPRKTLPVFKKYFKPKKIKIIDLKRGIVI